MKPIRRCWNVLHGSGVDLYSTDGHIESDRLGGTKLGQCGAPAGDSVWRPPSLGSWIGATAPFTHHHILFHPANFLSTLKFLDWIKTKQHVYFIFIKSKTKKEWKYYILVRHSGGMLLEEPGSVYIQVFAHSLVFNAFSYVQCLGASQCVLFRQCRALAAQHKEVQCGLIQVMVC